MDGVSSWFEADDSVTEVQSFQFASSQTKYCITSQTLYQVLVNIYIYIYIYIYGDRGGAVIRVLCYKSEGRWFDSRWCHWNFSLT